MAILQISDFDNGRFMLPTNTWQEDTFEDYIDRVEGYYLPRLFGKELYDLFIADLTPSTPQQPQSARFLQIFNPFVDQTDDSFTQSEGIKVMLQGLVYYRYIRDSITTITTNGAKKTNSENATTVTASSADINKRYNESIESYKVIQNYMLNVEPDTYTEFEGIYECYNHSF